MCRSHNHLLRKTPAPFPTCLDKDCRWRCRLGYHSEEKMDVDRFAGPFCGIYSASIGAETCSVGLRICSGDLTASVRALTRGIDEAVLGCHATGEPSIVRKTAAWTGVQCHGV